MGKSSDTSAATHGIAVTPHDTNILTGGTCRALHVGTAGTLAVTMASDADVTFTGASGWLPIQVKRVKSTGTSAADIVALF
jgi:hypothetical protein